MSKHTPGPWVVARNTPDAGYSVRTDGEGSFRWIAAMAGKGDTDAANARLIAAAPELLAMLKRMIGAAEHGRDGLALDDAKALIAKAEGK